MEANAQRIISYEEHVEELSAILSAHDMKRDKQQLDLLLGQMKAMEKNYHDTLKELAGVKSQLRELTEAIGEPKQGMLAQIAYDAEAKLAEQYNAVKKIGHSLNEGAKRIVEKFKEIGIKALNNVCKFLGIKEKLVALRDCARSNETAMKNSIEKIEKVEHELGAAKLHAKNVLRALSGKETLAAEEGKKSRFFEAIKSPYRRQQEKYAKRHEKLSRAIDKFDSLEKAANGYRGNDKSNRESVKEKLAGNQEAIKAKEQSQKEAQQAQKETKQHEKQERQHDNAAR